MTAAGRPSVPRGEQPCRHCGSCDGPPSCPDCDHADRPTVTDYPDASEVLDVIYEVGYASSSTVRRRLGLTFGQAEDVLAALGRYGIVGKAEGSAARKILVTRPEAEAILGMDDPEAMAPEAPAQAHPSPSVTDNARAEAERRWPRLYGPEETLTYPREAVREHTRAGFMAGAEWAAGRAETTTATDEDAARVRAQIAVLLTQHAQSVLAREGMFDSDETSEAVDAILALLATARTRPARDDLARAIASGYETDHPTPNRHDYRAADAVLALLRGGERRG